MRFLMTVNGGGAAKGSNGGMTTDTAAAHRAIEAVWRLESARIIAGLTGLTGDVGLADELAQDALVAALEQWPGDGIPAKPGAWLMLTAKHRAIDRLRRDERLRGKLKLLGRELETAPEGAPAEFDAVLDEHRIDDDLLRLMFISCHPVLSTRARIALTLRLLGGLGRVLAGLMPAEAEVHGLVALMEIQASRIPARLDAEGLPVPLPEQNRGRWDRLLIRRGFTALLRAQRIGGPPGPYVLQAAIAACHARARTAAQTDWDQIALLYTALAARTPSPVVKLNHAVAVAMAGRPQQALAIVDGLAAGPELAGYHHLPSVRGDLLARLGRHGEAAAEFRRAAGLTRNAPERTVLLRRAAECDAGGGGRGATVRSG